jgi:GNAT superfamily N-acetyltransferase
MSKNTDQWAKPWPSRVGHKERIRNDLLRGKTWLVWDDKTVAATITIDTDEPVSAQGRPIWPAHKRGEAALYVRRVIVRRKYSGLRLGAGLLDWAADVAKRDYGATLIRIDVWTTNTELHAYYEEQGFTRCPGRDPAELPGYPAQVLFERELDQAGSRYTELFTESPEAGSRGGCAIRAQDPR